MELLQSQAPVDQKLPGSSAFAEQKFQKVRSVLKSAGSKDFKTDF